MLEQLTFIPASEAAEMVGASAQTIRNLCKAKTIRCQMRGNLFYACQEDIEKYANSISEINQIERDIESYKADILHHKEELEQADSDLRERLIAIDMFPHRIQSICEILSAVLDLFEEKQQYGLFPRDRVILFNMLQGKSLGEVGDILHITRDRARAQYYAALRRLAGAQNAIRVKDMTIKELQQTIEELQKKNKEILSGQLNNDMRTLLVLVEDCDFSNRTKNGLTKAGVHRILDVVRYTHDDLCKLRNLGEKSITEIETWLTEHNLKLGMEIPA